MFPGYTLFEMPQDSIFDWIQNEESFYNDVHGLYDKWVDEGEVWSIHSATKEADALVRHIAQAIERFDFVDDKYTQNEIRLAVEEVMEDFEQYRDDEIAERLKNATRKATPEDLKMDAGDIEHARKYDELAKKIGVEKIKSLIPVSSAKVRQALERGDMYLNSISLRKWDQAALNLSLQERSLSLSEGVCVLKHVARWHYA